MAEVVRLSETMSVRCPPALADAIERAAQKNCSKAAEYIRQAILTAVRADGFDPAHDSFSDAGAFDGAAFDADDDSEAVL